MVQYLLNATGVWLVSLVLFDLFLRRESYHGYNRFYLIATFLFGALLPLWQWQDDAYVLRTAEQPLANVIRAKQNIITVSTSTSGSPGWQQVLLITYLAGILVVASLMLADIFRLVAFYRMGKKSKQGQWTIVETNKQHAPFSFLNTLFVCSIKQYNTGEWSMLVTHEQQHTILFHFADLLLLQLARIVLWFHPLVYVYNKRLLMVHEFQADNAAATQPGMYGHFLVEQAVLQGAPSITHSFNRSPIKNRIVMLTRTSSAAAKGKMLVLLPLIALSMLCFSKNSFSQKPAVKWVRYVKLGNINPPNDNQKPPHCSYDEVIANPVLTALVPDCEIKGFTMTILPKGDFLKGPYKTVGPEIKKEQMAILQECKRKGPAKIIFEDIHIRYKGKDMDAEPVLVTCDR